MSNPNGAKGTSAESAVAGWLNDLFPHGAERRVKNGTKDRGDIWVPGVPVVIEVKNHARMELAQWVDELLVEMANDKASTGVVWHKRRGKGHPMGWYCTMTGGIYASLLHKAYWPAVPR